MKSHFFSVLAIVLLSSTAAGQEQLKMPFGSTDEQFSAALEKRKSEKTFEKILHLSLHKAQITDDGLAPLRGLLQLKKLSLSDTRITDAGLAHLEGLTQLEKLDLYATKISDQGLVILGRLIRLRGLALRRTPITDAGLAHLANLSQLEHLDLREIRLTDAALSHLKVLKSLRQINLRGTRVTSAGVRAFEKVLPQCWIESHWSPSVVRIPDGEITIKMHSGATDDQFFGVLARLEKEKEPAKIVNIFLHRSRITDAGLALLRGLSQLKALSLNDTGVTDVGLTHLEGLEQLEQIDLYGTKISNTSLEILGRLRRLRRLALRRTLITDAGLAHLTKLGRLELLDLRDTRITDAASGHLQALQSLRELDLRRSKVTPEGIRAIEKVLPSTKIRHSHARSGGPPLIRRPLPGSVRRGEEPTPPGVVTRRMRAGTLRVEVVRPEGIEPHQIMVQLYDFKSDLFRVGKMLLEGVTYHHSAELPGLRVHPIDLTGRGDTHLLTVPPGTYHVRVMLPSGESRWIPDQQISIEQETRVTARFDPPGELLVSWTLDRGKLRDDGTYATAKGTARLYLVRGGVIHASTAVRVGEQYFWKAIPTGTYSLVVWNGRDAADAIWTEDDVVVSSGEQTEKKVRILRQRLGTVVLCPFDAGTGQYIDTATENQILLDEGLRFAVLPEEKSTGLMDKNKVYYGRMGPSIKIPCGLTALFRIPGYEPYEQPLFRVYPPRVQIIPGTSSAEKMVKILHAKRRILLIPK